MSYIEKIITISGSFICTLWDDSLIFLVSLNFVRVKERLAQTVNILHYIML